MNSAAIPPPSASTVLMLAAVTMLLFPVFGEAEALGVVVSRRPCLRFRNAGMIHKHPLLFGYIGSSM